MCVCVYKCFSIYANIVSRLLLDWIYVNVHVPTAEFKIKMSTLFIRMSILLTHVISTCMFNHMEIHIKHCDNKKSKQNKKRSREKMNDWEHNWKNKQLVLSARYRIYINTSYKWENS